MWNLNTAVEKDGKKGWLNIGYWENVPFTRNGKTTIFRRIFWNYPLLVSLWKVPCPGRERQRWLFFS